MTRLLIIAMALIGCKAEPWEQDPCKNKRPIIETEQPDSMSVALGTRISVYFTAQDFEGDPVWFTMPRHNIPFDGKNALEFDSDTAIISNGMFSFRTDNTDHVGHTYFAEVIATDGKCMGDDTVRFKIHIIK